MRVEISKSLKNEIYSFYAIIGNSLKIRVTYIHLLTPTYDITSIIGNFKIAE